MPILSPDAANASSISSVMLSASISTVASVARQHNEQAAVFPGCDAMSIPMVTMTSTLLLSLPSLEVGFVQNDKG
jgi:hypothetical protein